MITLILIVVAILIIGFLLFAASRPDTMKVERTISIDAKAHDIFPHIANFHKWTAWSPYEKLDPDMVRTYGGSEKGKGATYEWTGNTKVGAGRMEITDTEPSKINIKLEFVRPMKATNPTEFTLADHDGRTEVTWSMSAKQQLIGKIMCIFMSLDNLVGRDFEKGLKNLKNLCENK